MFKGRPSCDDIKAILLWIDEYNKSVDKDARIRTSLEIEKTTRIGLGNMKTQCFCHNVTESMLARANLYMTLKRHYKEG